jgi:hypothetical protein
MLSYELVQPFVHRVPVVFGGLMDAMSTASRGSWGWHGEATATPLIIFWWGRISCLRALEVHDCLCLHLPFHPCYPVPLVDWAEDHILHFPLASLVYRMVHWGASDQGCCCYYNGHQHRHYCCHRYLRGHVPCLLCR